MNWFTGKTKKLWLWHPKFYPILGIIEIFLNNKNSHFKLLLNTCHQVQFHKNVYVSRKVQKCYFGAKITHYPILGMMTVFLKNPNSHFEPLFKACCQLQFQITLIIKDLEYSSKVTIFCQCLIYSILDAIRTSQKRASSLFFIYWTLTSCKKSEKRHKQILRKRHYRGMKGWIEGWTEDGQTDGWRTEMNS